MQGGRFSIQVLRRRFVGVCKVSKFLDLRASSTLCSNSLSWFQGVEFQDAAAGSRVAWQLLVCVTDFLNLKLKS